LQNRCAGVQAIAARIGSVEFAPSVEFVPDEVEIAPDVEENEVLDFIPIEIFSMEPAPVPAPIEVVPIVPLPVAPPVIVPEEIVPEEIVPEEIVPEKILPEVVLPEVVLPEEILPQEIVPEEIPLPEASPPTIPLDKIDRNALLACVIVCFLCRR